ncbi:tropomyosin-1 [Hydra vulgaris]|uniref:tropomyosin-1 n=1 Tax=Hydra vulgaris TaxID=6087 RepID=UPI00019266E6|nr:tropomyosin-1 [Hydra vulgaris]
MQAVRNKMATLKAKLEEAEKAAFDAEEELKATNEKADQAEERVTELTKELNDLEDQLDASESKMTSLQEKLAEAEKLHEEHDQARRILENRGRSDGGRISRLQDELDELTNLNNKVVETFNELTQILAEADEKLDQEEERRDIADAKVKLLEVEVTQVGNTLRSMEINEGQASVRTECGDTKISEMEAKYQEMEARAAEFEEKAKRLERRQEELDEELQLEKDKFNQTKTEFDALCAHINEM